MKKPVWKQISHQVLIPCARFHWLSKPDFLWKQTIVREITPCFDLFFTEDHPICGHTPIIRRTLHKATIYATLVSGGEKPRGENRTVLFQ